ncbi:MAG: Ig-like domain-containing protein, partial [Croceitalea sp.]|nr:Ig-like domain-containing protein [Croceitalea sp.]
MLTVLFVVLAHTNVIFAQTTVTSRVSANTDDAEQRISNGSVNDGDADLELAFDGGDNQLIGLRFQNVNVPAGAIISSATIQFTSARADSGLTSLTISGQNSDNPSTFLEVNNNISSRPLTLASVAWNTIPAWDNPSGQAGPDQRTPNLSNIIQEITLRPGWNQGQAMAFVISGTGTRHAESHNGSATQAPLLSITYTLPPLPPNANDDNFATYNSNRVDFDVLANDTDPNNNLDPYSLTNTTALVVPGEGEYEIRPDNTIRFTPEPTFVGTSTLGYSICDDTPAGSGGPFCDTATLSVQVIASPCGVGQVVTGGNA